MPIVKFIGSMKIWGQIWVVGSQFIEFNIHTAKYYTHAHPFQCDVTFPPYNRALWKTNGGIFLFFYSLLCLLTYCKQTPIIDISILPPVNWLSYKSYRLINWVTDYWSQLYITIHTTADLKTVYNSTVSLHDYPPSTGYQPWWIEGQAQVTQCWINSIKTDLELVFQ